MSKKIPRRATAVALAGMLGFALASAAAAPAAAAAHTIDVVVVYPLPAEQHMERIVQVQINLGETEMGAFLAANFARISQIYQQSGVDVAFHVVHHEQVDFSSLDPLDWQETLSGALMNSELGLALHAPYLVAIEAIRDLHSGDIVIYWRDFQDGGPIANGAGSLGGGEDEAYVQLTYFGIAPHVVAHETGHLLGAQHSDGVQSSSTYSIDGDGPALREYRTVMTVAVPLGLSDRSSVWRFSANGAIVEGDIDCTTFPTSTFRTCSFDPAVPLGDATHNAASVLAAMVPTVAAFRESAPAVPAASPSARFLLVLLLGASGLAAFARRREPHAGRAVDRPAHGVAPAARHPAAGDLS